MSVAWDNFVTSLDPAELEGERCRVVSNLGAERPMGRKHRQMVFEHEKRAVVFWRRADSGSWLPMTEKVVKATTPVKRKRRKPVGVMTTKRQLEIALAAQQAARGAVSDSAGRVASPTHTNTSTTLKPANGRTDSQFSFTNKWIPTSTKREEAA